MLLCISHTNAHKIHILHTAKNPTTCPAKAFTRWSVIHYNTCAFLCHTHDSYWLNARGLLNKHSTILEPPPEGSMVAPHSPVFMSPSNQCINWFNQCRTRKLVYWILRHKRHQFMEELIAQYPRYCSPQKNQIS